MISLISVTFSSTLFNSSLYCAVLYCTLPYSHVFCCYVLFMTVQCVTAHHCWHCGSLHSQCRRTHTVVTKENNTVSQSTLLFYSHIRNSLKQNRAEQSKAKQCKTTEQHRGEQNRAEKVKQSKIQ
jgi:hypothetical protein